MHRKHTKSNTLPIGIFNGTVVTTDGLYRIQQISIEEAKQLVATHSTESAVGHSAAANLLSDILGISVNENRIQFVQQPGQLAIALKLNIRPQEGAVLTKAEMLSIGFTLRLIERLE